MIEVDEGDFDEAIAVRDELAETEGYFNCNQFHNPLNIEVHYKNTGPEIERQIRSQLNNYDYNGWPQAFVAGTGTGGTIMGCGKYLKTLWPDIKITSASALATPAAIVPTPEAATNLTVTLQRGLICFKS